MKNYLLAFLLALLVVLTGMSLRRSVAGMGTSPVPMPPECDWNGHLACSHAAECDWNGHLACSDATQRASSL